MKTIVAKKAETAAKIVKFLHFTEQLKCELRHGWTTTGRQESVADHSWRTAMLLVLCAPYLAHPIDIKKALKMAIIHDLVEAISGDVHFLKCAEGSQGQVCKNQAEKSAIKRIKYLAGGLLGDELYCLWNEYHSEKTYESRVIAALDKLEAIAQHNEADISTWTKDEVESFPWHDNKHFDFDPVIASMAHLLLHESDQKIGEECPHTIFTK